MAAILNPPWRDAGQPTRSMGPTGRETAMKELVKQLPTEFSSMSSTSLGQLERCFRGLRAIPGQKSSGPGKLSLLSWRRQ